MDRFTHDPKPAIVGQGVTICYENSDRPYDSIPVTLSNALNANDPGYEEIPLVIEMDQHGYGCVLVNPFPDWVAHVVGAADSDDHPILTA